MRRQKTENNNNKYSTDSRINKGRERIGRERETDGKSLGNRKLQEVEVSLTTSTSNETRTNLTKRKI